MTDHYIGCVDLDCPGCLPTDDDLREMGTGRLQIELRRRGLLPVPVREGKLALLLDTADDYRARSAEARRSLTE